MDTDRARELLSTYGPAVSYIEVEDSDGTHGIGSSVHVGEGVFVTARHVIEGKRIVSMATALGVRTPIEKADDQPSSAVRVAGPWEFEMLSGPFFTPDPRIDVAAFQVSSFDPQLPAIELGGHLDDWIGQTDFVMSEAIVLGYPPVPLTGGPYLVAARAEVNVVIDRRDVPHVHFVLSATPRGGFSGGAAISEYGFLLGLATESLTADTTAPVEAGWLTVLSIEPIYALLAEHKLLPVAQTEWSGDLFGTDTVQLCGPGDDPTAPPLGIPAAAWGTEYRGCWVAASVSVFDNGRRAYVAIQCDDDLDTFLAAERAVRESLAPVTVDENSTRRTLVEYHIDRSTDANTAGRLARHAAQAALATFVDAGYTPLSDIDIASRFVGADD